MKNIFGINVTDDKENTEFDGNCFKARTVSEPISQQLESMYNIGGELKRKASAPLWLNIIEWIVIFIAIIITLGELKSDVSIKQSWKNAPELIIIGVAAWIVYFLIRLYTSKKIKKVAQSEEFEDYSHDVDKLVDAAMRDLRIPSGAKSIDVISDKYKIKNDKIKQVNYHTYFSHLNLDYFIYVSDGMLCLADFYTVYEIPLTSIASVKQSAKKAMFPAWHKDEDYNSKKYKEFKITMNSQGTYFAPYFKVSINDAKGDFLLLIPNYDQPLFSELTGVFPE